MNTYYVYIMASKRNGTLYIGITSSLKHRVWEHKNGETEGFTARYGIDKLVYFETTDNVNDAIRREKQLKKWQRAWKKTLIESVNPGWNDLFDTLEG